MSDISNLLDNSEIDPTCPACGHEFQERLGRLKHNPSLTCPNCGGTIDIDFEGRESLDKANRALRGLEDTIDDLNRG